MQMRGEIFNKHKRERVLMTGPRLRVWNAETRFHRRSSAHLGLTHVKPFGVKRYPIRPVWKCLNDSASALGLECHSFETRFHRRSSVHLGLTHVKPFLVKLYPIRPDWKFGIGVRLRLCPHCLTTVRNCEIHSEIAFL
ncbi:hypothetical protein AVEN_51229-1 [Araneus ventricosus]|uniref:Uncharacterized protein n=1 Tax=Araneus ventricosus TaxID=182803 RepID=A0A4Y2LY96_ARAVE|nr:hypothetical protein AVEN_51229-1 [Araneus ventricosus]